MNIEKIKEYYKQKITDQLCWLDELNINTDSESDYFYSNLNSISAMKFIQNKLADKLDKARSKQ